MLLLDIVEMGFDLDPHIYPNNDNDNNSSEIIRREAEEKARFWGNNCVRAMLIAIIFFFLFLSTSLFSCVGNYEADVEAKKTEYAQEIHDTMLTHDYAPLELQANDRLVKNTYVDYDDYYGHIRMEYQRADFEKFENASGVLPFLYIAEPDSKNSLDETFAAAEEMYDAVFESDNGALFYIVPRKGNGYMMGYALGDRARDIFDDEAMIAFTTILSDKAKSDDNGADLIGDASASVGTLADAMFPPEAQDAPEQDMTWNTIWLLLLLASIGVVISAYLKTRKYEKAAGIEVVLF